MLEKHEIRIHISSIIIKVIMSGPTHKHYVQTIVCVCGFSLCSFTSLLCNDLIDYGMLYII
jgi:hypothetical protein